MGFYEIPTIPPRTLVPTNLTAHKALDVVDWGVTSAVLKGQFTPTHGTRNEFTRDTDLTYRVGDIFEVPHNTSTNMRVSINAGSQHYGNVEVQLLEQRWPNNLLGYSFEYRQDSTRNNSIFFVITHVWWDITSNTHRTWGVDFDGESRKAATAIITITSIWILKNSDGRTKAGGLRAGFSTSVLPKERDQVSGAT